MDPSSLCWAVLIVVLLILFWVYLPQLFAERLDTTGATPLPAATTTSPTPPKPTFASGADNTPQAQYISQDPRSFYELTDGEKIQYIIDHYFESPQETGTDTAARIARENTYIKSLPQNSSCSDDYNDCATWAANNECIINPEFMLYHCPSSCAACSLTPQDKWNLVQIYNNRDPPNCVSRGRGYPDPNRTLQQFYSYFNEDVLI
jgi:hypothetical protein